MRVSNWDGYGVTLLSAGEAEWIEGFGEVVGAGIWEVLGECVWWGVRGDEEEDSGC